MKLCPDNHENLDAANFCCVCGKPISTTQEKKTYPENKDANEVSKCIFTPDSFPNIKLQPKSVYKISFGILPILFIAIVLFLLTVSFVNFRWTIFRELKNYCGYSYAYIIYDTIPIILSLLLLLFGTLLFWKCWKKIVYNINTSFIENDSFIDCHRRIAKAGMLGLFDARKHKVLLPSAFSIITIYNCDFLLIEKNRLQGMYSLKNKSMVIPVKYDRIENFENSIFTTIRGNERFYYDVNGNELK